MPEVDLKLTQKEKKKRQNEMKTCSPSPQEYPWGTTLTLEKADVEKIPALMNGKKGDKLRLDGKAFIKSVTEAQRDGEPDEHSVTIQIEKIGIYGEKDKEFKAGFDLEE
ncbi:MAG: hypothetical protein GY861_28050 [bacterium]|nr:hypothetical protein [bacterium]